jgi:hypothetical protein
MGCDSFAKLLAYLLVQKISGDSAYTKSSYCNHIYIRGATETICNPAPIE